MNGTYACTLYIYNRNDESVVVFSEAIHNDCVYSCLFVQEHGKGRILNLHVVKSWFDPIAKKK